MLNTPASSGFFFSIAISFSGREEKPARIPRCAGHTSQYHCSKLREETLNEFSAIRKDPKRFDLTERELEVLALMIDGLNNM